jgi:hypothetical protein
MLVGMNTLRIENHIRDYTSWKQAFDKYDALRRDKGVRSYRITRLADDPLHIFIDLVFDSATRAEDFGEALTRIWRTPQSRELLTEHAEPVLLDVIDEVHYPDELADSTR